MNKDVRAGSACPFVKLALTATLGLAITLTLNACGKGGSDAKLLETITYDDGRVQKFEYDKQNRIVKIDDEAITYADNLVTAGTKKFVINGNTVTIDGNSLTIDKDGYIVSLKRDNGGCAYDGKKDEFIEDAYLEKYEYKDGNLTTITHNACNGETSMGGSTNYKYDSLKSPFSNSNTPKWLLQYLLNSYNYSYNGSKNNVIETTFGGDCWMIYLHKYEYDSDGFPTKHTIEYNSNESVSCGDEMLKTGTTRYTYRGGTQNATASEAEAAKARAEAEAEAEKVKAEAEAEAEAAAENEPKYFECGGSDAEEAKAEAKWSMGQSNDACTRIVGSGKKYTRAVKGSRMYKIKYIGEKKERREERDMEFYFGSYETSCGSDYEIIDGKECIRDLFLYNDSDKWGGVPDNIVFKDFEGNRPKVGNDDIAAMEKLQNGRKIILSEVIADFSIEGKSNRLMLARYKNTKKDGMFQIVLRDHNNDYFTADFPSGLDENGQPNWRADMGDEIGSWELYFVGRVAEGLFLVTVWCAAEGCGTTAFVARDGKLEDWQGKDITEPTPQIQNNEAKQ